MLQVQVPQEYETPYSPEELKIFWKVIDQSLAQLTHQNGGFEQILKEYGYVGPWSDKDEFVEAYCSYVGELNHETYNRLLNTNLDTLDENLVLYGTNINRGVNWQIRSLTY